MRIHQFKSEQWVPRPIEEIFSFFSDPNNLAVITPPRLKFQVLTPPIQTCAGTRLQYKLSLHGIPVRWESKITAWRPPHFFSDDQLRGPYRLWHHEHQFSEKDGGTLLSDLVTYAVPGGALVNRFFVAPDLRRIFDFRRQKIDSLFPKAAAS
jgi:ligand-binding SRPBCC domain-containing protein